MLYNPDLGSDESLDVGVILKLDGPILFEHDGESWDVAFLVEVHKRVGLVDLPAYPGNGLVSSVEIPGSEADGEDAEGDPYQR